MQQYNKNHNTNRKKIYSGIERVSNFRPIIQPFSKF